MENETFIEQTKAYLLLVKEHEGNAAFQQMAHVLGGTLKTTRKAGLKMWAKQIVTPPVAQPTPVVKPQAPTVPQSLVAGQPPKGKAESKKQKLHPSKNVEPVEELPDLSTIEAVMEAFGGDGELMREYLMDREKHLIPNTPVVDLARLITEL